MAASTPTDSQQTSQEDHIQYWANRWKEGRTGWHLGTVEPNLIKFMDKLTLTNTGSETATDSKNEQVPKKFFVPLCGKTMDLAYLLSLGHQVFAVEGVVEAINTLEAENSFGLTFHPETSTFETPNGQLVIWIGNLFECPFEKWGPFDCVWDRGSFIALEFDLRGQYIEAMKRSLQDPTKKQKYHNFKYLLEVVQYDKSLYPGPPRCVDESDMDQYYRDWTNVELLSAAPMRSDSGVQAALVRTNPDKKVELALENFYLITPKD